MPPKNFMKKQLSKYLLYSMPGIIAAYFFSNGIFVTFCLMMLSCYIAKGLEIEYYIEKNYIYSNKHWTYISKDSLEFKLLHLERCVENGIMTQEESDKFAERLLQKNYDVFNERLKGE